MQRMQFNVQIVAGLVGLFSVVLAITLEAWRLSQPADTAIQKLTAGGIGIAPAYDSPPEKKWVHVKGNDWTNSRHLRHHFRRLGPIKTLTLDEVTLTNAQLDALSKLQSVDEMEIVRVDLSDQVLDGLLKRWPSLQEVILTGCNFLDRDIRIDAPRGVRRLAAC